MKVRLIIREVAEAKGFNQSRLFQEAKVSPQVVNRYWHNNVEGVTFDLLGKIAEALGVRPGDLLVAEE